MTPLELVTVAVCLILFAIVLMVAVCVVQVRLFRRMVRRNGWQVDAARKQLRRVK